MGDEFGNVADSASVEARVESLIVGASLLIFIGSLGGEIRDRANCLMNVAIGGSS